MNYRMNYHADTVTFPGTETPDSKVVQWNKRTNVMVFKTPGHSYWAMNTGPRGYMPAEYHVVQVNEVEDRPDDDYQVITATGIACFPVRS